MKILRSAPCALWFAVLPGLASISATPSLAEILVVAPHPDDEIITAAGVISRAVRRGETVRVVYVTNGDAGGSSLGYLREGETVAGQAVLGVGEDRLMFFGYPDENLLPVFTTATDPSSQFTSPNTGLSATYGNRGLGRVDYHTYRHGTAAPYNHPNMVADMEDVLATYLPTHVFVTSEFDEHADHQITYRIVVEALAQVIASHPGYNPTIHKTQVWFSSAVWPNPLDASVDFAEQPDVLARTGLAWSQRESLDVPPPMQLTMYGDNPKYMAVDNHASQQGAYQFLGRFVHKDEFFWTEQKSGTNAPPVPNAGSDQSVAEGAAVTLDGSASFDQNGDALSYQWTQSGGTPVALALATTAHPTLTAPSGLSQDALLTFELVVKDAALTSVPDAVNVRVAATSPLPPPVNIAPQASSITASSQNAGDGQTADKVADGVVDGYPGDYTKEWATQGEGAGAWIELGWSASHLVSSVRLHDRPNEGDQIAAGTLRFSDGSTVAVSRLPNPGAGLDVNFTPRTTRSLRFTIDAVVQASNIGLAEFLVFESSAVDRCAGVVCAASDSCHVAGTCDPATGFCSNPAAADGTSCSDGNACTRSESCQSGVCTGGSPVNCNDGNVCTNDSCSPDVGCKHKGNKVACDDGNACTTNDVCRRGVCAGTPVGQTTHLLISQIQTRGDGRTPSNDEFIEIFNPTGAPINAGNLTLVYKPVASYVPRSILTIPATASAVVPAHDWILVARSGYKGSVTPEFRYSSVDLAAGGGTVYLAASSGAVSCTSNKIIDKVAWGSGDCPETAAAVAPGANNSIMRRPANACGNGQDTNNNAADFVLRVPSAPRN